MAVAQRPERRAGEAGAAARVEQRPVLARYVAGDPGRDHEGQAVAEFERHFPAGAVAAVEVEKFQEIDDGLLPVEVFGIGFRHALLHDLFRVLRAAAQAPFKLFARWRQNEHLDDILARDLIELLGALPVNIEKNVLTLTKRRLDERARRAIVIAEDIRPFEELARIAHAEEFFLADEVIVLPVRFARPARSCRRGDRENDVLVGFQQALGERRLAGA